MILSGTDAGARAGDLRVDLPAHRAATDDLRARLADLEARRLQVATAVGELRTSWHGAAASRFGVQWEEWDQGAGGVLGALAQSLDGLDATRADLIDTDLGRADAALALGRRLG